MSNPLPYAPDAEQAVLASILLEPSAIYELDLEKKDFFSELNASIFGLMKECASSGESPDVPTLVGKAKDSGRAAMYLASLVASVPTPSLVGQYAKVVRRRRIQRDLLNAATLIADMAQNDEGVGTSELVPNAIGRLMRIDAPEKGAVRHVSEVIAEYMPKFEQMIDEQRDVWGIPTGLDIDKYIGGLIAGDLTIIAGPAGTGKTSLAMQTAFHVAFAGHGVLVFSLEMAESQYMGRMLSTIGNVNSEEIKRGKVKRTGDEYRRIKDESLRLSDAPLWIVDKGQTTDSIRAHLARMIQRGTKIEFVVIDYLDRLGDRGERDERVNGITRAVKGMSRDYDVCTWLLHAVNRKDELSLQSLKYGGDYDADEVILCGENELVIAKNRNGDTCKVPMVFRGGVTRWENPTLPGTPEPPRRIVSPPPVFVRDEWGNVVA
jgi:replicative DNA helicase